MGIFQIVIIAHIKTKKKRVTKLLAYFLTYIPGCHLGTFWGTLSERHIFQCHLGTLWETLSERHINIFLLVIFIPELKRSIAGIKSDLAGYK